MNLAAEKRELIDITETYLAARRFNCAAQSGFSVLFHRHYHAAGLDERISVAKRICRERSIPLDVVTLLCCDNDKVAAPVLSYSPLLSETDLTTQILQGSRAERRAIAQRSDLNATLVSHLLSFREKDVAGLLQQHADRLPHMSDQLRARVKRLAEATFEDMGHRLMTQEKDKLDALVSSMEQDWYAHYRPEMLQVGPSNVIVSGEQADEIPMPASAEDGGTVSLPLLEDEDANLLAKLNASDWDQLDDTALEALAEQLAMEEMGLEAETEAPAPLLEDEETALIAKTNEADWEQIEDGPLEELAQKLAREDASQSAPPRC